jgi:hypothetical protein
MAVAWAGGVVLNVALLARFGIAARYFYALSIPLVWETGILAAAVVQAVSTERGRAAAQFAMLAALLALPLKSAMWHAGTPEHNWRGAMEFLKPQVRPGDLLLCGPMADIEVLNEYAPAAGLAAAPQRWIQGAGGQAQDMFTVEGLRAGLNSGRRMWFVTPYWGAVRPSQYWSTIEHRMQHVATAEGKSAVEIWCSR